MPLSEQSPPLPRLLFGCKKCLAILLICLMPGACFQTDRNMALEEFFRGQLDHCPYHLLHNFLKTRTSQIGTWSAKALRLLGATDQKGGMGKFHCIKRLNTQPCTLHKVTCTCLCIPHFGSGEERLSNFA